MDFQSIINSLLGRNTTTTTLAPPMASYPTSDDADYARKYGFSEGNINQSYLDNQKARIFPANVPVGSSTRLTEEVLDKPTDYGPQVDLNKHPQAGVNDLAMRAALAANRIPVAAVGFDPSHVILDKSTPTDQAVIAGMYMPQGDTIYQNANYPSTMVHESIHRGLEQLRKTHPQEMQALDSKLPNEEFIVRWLMKNQAGNPEVGRGSGADKQIQTANALFGQGNYDAPLNQLNELAINEMKNRSRRFGPQ